MLFRPIVHSDRRRLQLAVAVRRLRLLAVRVGRWYALNQEVRRLARLDDHLLADMGIERDEIPARVRGRR